MVEWADMWKVVTFVHNFHKFAIFMTSLTVQWLELFQYIVGRSRSSSFIIRNLAVSKMHCIFKKTDGIWTVCDKVGHTVVKIVYCIKYTHINNIKAEYLLIYDDC
jgi:hypothetical protein